MLCPAYSAKTPVIIINTDTKATRISGKTAVKLAIKINRLPGI
jgi:hypothetical protein